MKRVNRKMYYRGQRCMLFKQVCKECRQLKLVYKKFSKRVRNGVLSIESTCNSCKHEQRRVEKKCIVCGKLFTTTHSKTQYCSEKCANSKKINGQIIQCENCGKEFYVTQKELNRSKHHYCSKECSGNAHCGERNSSFNPNLSEEDRLSRRRNIANIGYSKFRTEVLKRDNYTCQITGLTSKETTLIVHHLESYNLDKEKRVDISNGITLSKEIHSLFHKIYGYGNNTKAQFKEFKIQYVDTEVKENIIPHRNA